MLRPRRQERSVRMWTVIAVGVILIGLHFARVLEPIENLIVQSLSPGQSWLFGISQSVETKEQNNETSIDSLSIEDLQTRYIEVEALLEETLIENAKLKTLLQESTLLEEQIEFLRNQSLRGVSAKIISRATDGLSQSLVVNRGATDGIQVGYPVIIENGVLVGVVRETQDHIAEVELLTSFDSRISASIQNETQSPGIITGEHNLSLRMEFIPQLDVVEVGQSVVSSGSDPDIPLGLVIGQIQEVQNEPGSLFQQASLQPLFSATDILIVSILVP